MTAQDVDGFSGSTVQTLRVRDPQDSSAPRLTWGGALQANAANTAPVTLSQISLIQARITEAQMMGWKLEIAPATANVSAPATSTA